MFIWLSVYTLEIDIRALQEMIPTEAAADIMIPVLDVYVLPPLEKRF